MAASRRTRESGRCSALAGRERSRAARPRALALLTVIGLSWPSLAPGEELTLRAAASGAPPERPPAYEADAWVALGGPPGGLGYDIRYDFSDFNRWYVTDDFAGIFYSDDRGMTWRSSNQGLHRLDGELGFRVADFCATVDPHRPSTIWTGLDIVGHVYRSTDRGHTWVAKDDGLAPQAGQSFRGFTVHPDSSDVVYLASELLPQGSPGRPTAAIQAEQPTASERWAPEARRTPSGMQTRSGRLYRTRDGGESWERIWEGPALARYIWIAPDEPNRIYVSTGFFDREPINLPEEPTPEDMGGVGVLRSTDGGATWTVLGKDRGLRHLYVGSLYMKPDDSRTLLAGAGSITTQPFRIVGGEEVPNGGVFLTTDGGDSWREVVPNEHITSVEYCQQDPAIAYAASERAVFRSEDGGRTWARYGDPVRETWGPPGLAPGVPVDMQTDPEDCGRVFINNYVGGNFLSTDGGRSWAIASAGYTGADPPRIFVDPDDDRRVWTITRMAPWESRDGGAVWIPRAVPALSAGGESMGVDPSDADHLFIDSGAAIYESEDGGRSWILRRRIECPPDLPEQHCAGLMHLQFAFAPSDPRTIYAGTVQTALMPEDTLDPRPDGLGIVKSTDGGKHWTALTHPAIARHGFRALAVSPHDPATVYAGGRLNGLGLWKSSDGGMTWERREAGLPRPIGSYRVIAIDPADDRHLLLGGMQGLFRSADAGGSWTQVAAGLEAGAMVTTILFDRSRPSVVYAGTTAGVVYSTDGGRSFLPLNQGLGGGGILASCLALSADGSVLYASSIGTYRLGTPSAPSAPPATSLRPGEPNPFFAETVIRYALARDSEVELRVHDVTGRLVTVLDRGPRPMGDHEVVWDGRDAAGDRVRVGIYFLRLKAGSEVLHRKVVRLR
jgi:photosystem II stability/assembly factor-like uncharacterized protein